MLEDFVHPIVSKEGMDDFYFQQDGATVLGEKPPEHQPPGENPPV